MIRTITLALLLCIGGCSFFTPGLDQRTALETKDHVRYSLEDLEATVDSTHDGTTVIVEGAGTVTPDPNGGPPVIAGAEGGIIWYRTSDRAGAADVYTQMGAMNLQAWTTTAGYVNSWLGNIAGIVGAARGPAPAPANPTTCPAGADCPVSP